MVLITFDVGPWVIWAIGPMGKLSLILRTMVPVNRCLVVVMPSLATLAVILLVIMSRGQTVLLDPGLCNRVVILTNVLSAEGPVRGIKTCRGVRWGLQVRLLRR